MNQQTPFQNNFAAPFHTHNGVDSPLLASTVSSVISYSGSINANNSVIFLPTGWTTAHPATGRYTITHNLGVTTYAVTAATAFLGHDNVAYCFNMYNISANSFTISISEAANSNATNFPFNFILTVTT